MMDSSNSSNSDGSSKYRKIMQIGEGTFGVVHLGVVVVAHDEDEQEDKRKKTTAPVVAIKKVRLADAADGIHFTALREVKLLQEVRHDNVLKLVDVYMHKRSLHLVYEFLDTDLDALIRDPGIALYPHHIKTIMHMILQAVHACHSRYIMHRDIKPGNLLLSASDGRLVLGDFGLARMYGDSGSGMGGGLSGIMGGIGPDVRYTPQSVTRWYRAPELLFGADLYGPSVDMWSVGCVFAELMLRTPYFPGDSDLDQLAKIFAALGTPTDDMWPDMRSLPNYVEFEEFPATPFRQLFTAASDDALDLLSRLLAFDPRRRITAEQALRHRYFTSDPLPAPSHTLPMPKTVLQQKMQREERLRKQQQQQQQDTTRSGGSSSVSAKRGRPDLSTVGEATATVAESRTMRDASGEEVRPPAVRRKLDL